MSSMDTKIFIEIYFDMSSTQKIQMLKEKMSSFLSPHSHYFVIFV
jgi:hypothetical protein